MQRIVIVGGGAGGLVLATRLGRRLGRKGLAEVVLVDAVRTHVWKPLLHQLAAGTFDTHAEEIDYLAQARWNNFTFRVGKLDRVDRAARQVHLATTVDDHGNEIIPAQTLDYSILVIAIGSLTNDFGTPGAAEHTIRLDSPDAARRFNDDLINACLRSQLTTGNETNQKLAIAIVGGGATGVELAAELHAAARMISHYGFERINPEQDLRIVLLEAGPCLLPQLPPRLGTAAARELRKLAIEVHTEAKVVAADADGLVLAGGRRIDSAISVWAAGVKAPEILRTFCGDAPLETNAINQLVVKANLQTTLDGRIYALGDCAACPRADGGQVPPRAQAAYQQAHFLARELTRGTGRQSRRRDRAFVFRDRGSLVSLAQYASIGSLMGRLSRGTLFIEGHLARLMYWALHKQHQLALGGLIKTALITLSELIDRAHRPRIKLH